MYTGFRQMSRGGMSGPDPPRRRRFRGQYIRRRTPSGGYRAGSFSDDRNDSSPPPNQRDLRSMDDQQQQQQQFAHQNYPQRVQRASTRGSRQNNQRQFYDNSYQRQSRRNYEASDIDYNDQNDQQQQQHQQHPPQQPQQHHVEVPSSQRETNNHLNSSRRVDDLSKLVGSQSTEIDELRVMLSKLSTELDQVKNRVKELESSNSKSAVNQPQAGGSTAPKQVASAGDKDAEKEKRRKSKILRQREKKAMRQAEKRAAISDNQSVQQDRKILNPEQNDKPLDSMGNQNFAENNTERATASTSKYNRRTNRERNTGKPRARRDYNVGLLPEPPRITRLTHPNQLYDDSTTQAAEPSSEDRPDGEDGREGTAKEKVRVFRRKKQHFNRRGAYGNRRRRAESSERNSNDTSPQNEVNGNDEVQGKKVRNVAKKSYPELSESEITDIVQTLKREFVNLERPVKAIKSTMNEKGPKVVYEFAVSILDHAMCDVTSPTKLSEIAGSLYQLLVSEDNASEVDFQKGFYDALNDISKREDDIAIDAPRYLDTLGQVLADCVIRMVAKQKDLVKVFLNRCIESYSQQNKALLLASVMKGIAGVKDERFAKEVWDIAQLEWEKFLTEGTELNGFLESQEVNFTMQAFSPTPRAAKSPKELEKFADDVTALVEKRCTPQALEELVKDLNFDSEDEIEYLGTLVYASVRGCLVTDAGAYKLNNEALNKYSNILNTKNENQEAIALHALTALTKLWHQYNCPQDLFRTILQALHNQGIASHEALKAWLNSENLNNIPGIGAARLNSKRYIEDIEASELNKVK